MTEEKNGADTLNPALLIGIFLSVFGVCVLIAIPVTEKTSGKITNLVCGLLILIVSAVFIILSRRKPTI